MIAPVGVDPDVVALLTASALPIDDLADPAIALLGARTDDALVGVVGVQLLAGDLALLRSLAVDPAARTRGLGATLCDAAEALARARGIAALWLLTTTARDYFARRGYVEVARADVPDAVRATAQFGALCPASAVVMRRALG